MPLCTACFVPPLKSSVEAQAEILHIPVLYPIDMNKSSQSMLGILRRFTFDPGISDQFTEISEIGMPNHLQR